MATSDKKKKKSSFTDPATTSIQAELAKKALPNGLYITRRQVRVPSWLKTYPDETLVPYLLLLHDINLLVREWRRVYRERIKHRALDRDVEDVVDQIMELRKIYRQARVCPYCGSSDTTHVYSQRSSDGKRRVQRRECQHCRKRFNRPVPAQLHGHVPPIVLKSTEELLREGVG
jgi:hypothetical protein